MVEGEIEERIPEDEIETCLCSRGTLLFCDTSGFHRGGYAIRKERLLAHWTYASAASLWPRRFEIMGDISGLEMSDHIRFALQ